MGIRDTLAKIVNPVDENRIEIIESAVNDLESEFNRTKLLQEQSAYTYYLAEIEGDAGWRSISDTAISPRDFTEQTHREIGKMAWTAVMTNPIAAREIFYKTVFVAGRGLRCTSQIPEIQKKIDEFWTARRNKIPYYFPMYINRFNIDGEAFFLFFVNTKTGRVTLREIEPAEITEIVFDPDDSSVPVFFKREWTRKGGAKESISPEKKETLWYQSVDVLEHPELKSSVTLPNNAKIAGETSDTGKEDNLKIFVFHFKNSLLTNRRRGLSTLTNHLPWLREHKDILRARTTINKGRAAYFLDVSIKDGTTNDVQRESLKHKYPPRTGSVVVHSDKLTYSFLTPNIQGADVQSDLSEIKNMTAVGSMLPPDLMGESGKSNYQNAGRTKFPFLRSMEFQQELWEYALKYGIMWVVLHAAIEYGDLPETFKVAKKLSISNLALTQEGEVFDTQSMVILPKKQQKVVKNHIRAIVEAANVASLNDPTSAPLTPKAMGNVPPTVPGGDPAKAEQMMDDYVVIHISEEVDAIDLVDVTFPRIDTENLSDMAMAFQVFDAMKIASKRTLSKLAGFDYEKEKEIVAQETAEAMRTMEQQQAKLAAGAGDASPFASPEGMGPPNPAGGGRPDELGQGGNANSASNIQKVLADILNRPGRANKRGPISESYLASKLVESWLENED